MLKKGLAWHYTAYDKRPELAKVKSFFLDRDENSDCWAFS